MTAMPPPGPPPPGWQPPSRPHLPFRYPHAGYGRSLLASLACAGVNLLVIIIVVGAPPSARAAGYVIGSLLATAAIAALPVWLIARTRSSGWPFWQLALLALPFFLVLRVALTVAS